VILDLGLPDMDGMTVLQQMRGKHSCGLLVVTGRSDTHDRVMGLELGADDYVVKPFEPRELIARVRSILRRYPGQVVLPADPAQRVAEFAGWRFAPGSNTLTSPSGQQDTLSTAEAQLLSVLLAHPNHILTREQLLGGRDVGAGPQHRPARLPPAPPPRGRPPARQAHQDGVRRRLPAGRHRQLVLSPGTGLRVSGYAALTRPTPPPHPAGLARGVGSEGGSRHADTGQVQPDPGPR
jgi:hypothetical protein